MTKPPALWWMDTVEMIGFEPHFYLDVTQYLELKRQMMRCHKSQLARGGEGNFSRLDEMLIRQCQARGAHAGVPAAEAFRQHEAWKRLGAL